MKVVDIVILVVLILGAFRGFQKGLLLELIGLAAFVVGIIGAFKLMPLGVVVLEGLFGELSGLLPFISFIVIFVLIVLLLNLLGLILKKTIDMTIMGSFDDLAGALAGLVKWAFSISFLIWLMGYFHLTLDEEYTGGSMFYPFIASLAPWVIETAGALMPFIKEFFEPAGNAPQSPSRQA